jgi:glycosyltransferase involved in cell wall biosynthesis
MNNMSEKAPALSLIIPVYNRPDEVNELLDSLTRQRDKHFEVIIVEDGSTERCQHIVENYQQRLDLRYFFKENSGPGQSRNYGCGVARYDFLVFLDSDCVIPEGYVESVRLGLSKGNIDCYGGPDAALPTFNDWQKAINYSMTSFFTTGGIRGSSEKMDKFHPRSFNMGFSKQVFERTDGFSNMRFGEDIDLSLRIRQAGFRAELFKDAFVYHKRRSTLKQFFKQVHNSGIARINLHKRHPGSHKIVHALPAVFTIFVLSSLLTGLFFSSSLLLPLLIIATVFFIDATIKTGSIGIGGKAVLTSFVQLIGYGTGYLRAFWHRLVMGKDEFSAFTKNFYK